VHTNKARSLGYAVTEWPANVAKVATAHPHDEEKVILPRGADTDRKRALEAGFTVNEHVAAKVDDSLRAHKAWRSTILGMPEARERESAAVEIVTTQNRETMPIESARAFLRGLPTEQTEVLSTVTTKTDPRAARLAEIDGSMKSFNASRGFAPKPKAAASPASFDPVRLQRLADIRLAALTLRMERGEMAVAQEHKKLAYAISVHDKTGLPLANVFAQMEIDTSKMLA
jgi:hypothetical protein